MPETAERQLAAPTEEQRETAPRREQDSWERSGLHFHLLLGKKFGEGVSKKEQAELKKIANKNHLPQTKLADEAAANLSAKYWEGTDEHKGTSNWTENMNAYLEAQKGTDAEQFFKNIGFTIEEGGAEKVKNTLLFEADGLHYRESAIGEFAQLIVNNNEHQEIMDNMASIRRLAQLFGGLTKDERGNIIINEKMIDAVVDHVLALDNLRSNPDRFMWLAKTQMAMDENMAGRPILEYILQNSQEYNDKREAKIKEINGDRRMDRAIKGAKNSAVDDATRSAALAKDAEGIPLDPERNEPEALFAGKIDIADLKLEDEHGNLLEPAEALRAVLKRLSREDNVDAISDKIEGWVRHENFHFKKAKELYKEYGFYIWLSKSRDGSTFIVQPETYYRKPKVPNADEGELKAKIASAPGLGKNKEDKVGMSMDDLIDVHLYEFKKDPGGDLILSEDGMPIAEATPALKQAREYMNDPAKQQEIAAFIASQSQGATLSEQQRADKERDICKQIAFRKLREPDWQINLAELSLESSGQSETQA